MITRIKESSKRKQFIQTFVVFILFSFSISCSTEQSNQTEQMEQTEDDRFITNSDGVMIVEAEDMELVSAKVVETDSASGGKAILLLDSAAAGTIQLNLPKGKYVVDAVFSGTDFDHDGIYLVADGKMKRTAVHEKNQFAYGAKFLIFETDGKKPVTLQLTSRWENQPAVEYDIAVDRLEIAEFCSSSEVLERWTK